MSKNEFLPFGSAANANVLPNADYQALPARSAGFGSGVAKSEELNTVWRQSSTMAAVLGQFLANKTGQDVLDNGNVEALLGQLESAILSASPGRLINIQTFTSSGAYTPTPGTKRILVEVQGAGGGGGGAGSTSSSTYSAGGGGTAGGYAMSLLDINENKIVSVSVMVGIGGAGGSGSPTGGSSGGDSKFGTYVVAKGGNASLTQAPIAGAFTITGTYGGDASGGNIINRRGDNSGSVICTEGLIIAGEGGSSKFGAGGVGFASWNSNGRDAVGEGAGGGGATSTNSQGANYRGGNGSGGIVIIWEYA
ncbi:hypothetical protein WCU37_15925 [Serratia marcescens]|uniref:glycine-rich domain-containing protein n=1 Tax=Serratia marcescens TaxID=615 RepID=UPI0030CFC555